MSWYGERRNTMARTIYLLWWLKLAALCLFYTWFDGFTSTFQDKLFKDYNMEIHDQIFYMTICSCLLSLSGSNSQSVLHFLHYPYIWGSYLCYYNDHKKVDWSWCCFQFIVHTELLKKQTGKTFAV